MSDKITFADRRRNWARMLFGIPEAPARPDDIHARNYMEVIHKSGREGTTIPGGVYKTITHVGRNRWQAGVESSRNNL
jgi:hypothetical protein